MKRHVKSASLALIICAASVFAESTYEDVVKKECHFAEWGGTTKAEHSHCLKRVPLESLVLPTNGMDIVVRHKEDRPLEYTKDYPQTRLVHFAKEEKKSRYEKLKALLLLLSAK